MHKEHTVKGKNELSWVGTVSSFAHRAEWHAVLTCKCGMWWNFSPKVDVAT